MAYPNTTLNTYLESEVLHADPVRLVSLLYRGALEAVGAARRHLADGDIPARSAKIMKAWDILAELLTSLEAPAKEAPANESKDGKIDPQAQELVAQLHDLYGYMQQRLLDANAQQAEEPLAEVASLLTTLAEAWNGMAANPQVAAELETAREAKARRSVETSSEAPLAADNGTSAEGSHHDAASTGYEDFRYHPLRAAL